MDTLVGPPAPPCAANNVQLVQIRKKPVRTNWNNLLALGICLTTHPLSLLHPEFLPLYTTFPQLILNNRSEPLPLSCLHPDGVKFKCLWCGDCWPVRPWCIIHCYPITSTQRQPVTVSLSRSLAGLQLISTNTQSQDQLFAGMFCTKVFLWSTKNSVLSSNTMWPIFISGSDCKEESNLLELWDFRERQKAF